MAVFPGGISDQDSSARVGSRLHLSCPEGRSPADEPDGQFHQERADRVRPCCHREGRLTQDCGRPFLLCSLLHYFLFLLTFIMALENIFVLKASSVNYPWHPSNTLVTTNITLKSSSDCIYFSDCTFHSLCSSCFSTIVGMNAGNPGWDCIQ